MKLKVAFATDDGKTFMGRHFGDALFFDIYEFDNDHISFIKRIKNIVDEEDDVHADPKKAKGISALLLDEKVTVLVSKIFGHNIKRIKKKFVCIVVRDDEIDIGLKKICENIEKINIEWEKGQERKHLLL
ncbi:MAG: NifB/NifX family molybdenum-iron cluster-binding protein [Candidatus Celaenobacter antarcticus]|nr:NifB/NifX family molybdenum-iron cluster-binding protein [Candidatus Celaenobacter antarcticus]